MHTDYKTKCNCNKLAKISAIGQCNPWYIHLFPRSSMVNGSLVPIFPCSLHSSHSLLHSQSKDFLVFLDYIQVVLYNILVELMLL